MQTIVVIIIFAFMNIFTGSFILLACLNALNMAWTGCNEGMVRGAQSPGRLITMGEPNHLESPKNPNNVASAFFNSTFASEGPQVHTWVNQTCF